MAWVEEAFGETAACLTGLLGWIAGATDNAIYPTLFLDYVSSVVGAEESFVGWTRFLTLSAVTVVLALLNYTGLEIVGRSSLVVCVVASKLCVTSLLFSACRAKTWFENRPY